MPFALPLSHACRPRPTRDPPRNSCLDTGRCLSLARIWPQLPWPGWRCGYSRGQRLSGGRGPGQKAVLMLPVYFRGCQGRLPDAGSCELQPGLCPGVQPASQLPRQAPGDRPPWAVGELGFLFFGAFLRSGWVWLCCGNKQSPLSRFSLGGVPCR